MMAGVRDLEEARAAAAPLAELGYAYREHRPEAHLFVREGYGVHLTVPGSDLWRERLAFRDALRADPELAREYAQWKLEHVADDPRQGPYTADKRELVTRALARVGIDVKPDEQRLVPAVVAERKARRAGR